MEQLKGWEGMSPEVLECVKNEVQRQMPEVFYEKIRREDKYGCKDYFEIEKRCLESREFAENFYWGEVKCACNKYIQEVNNKCGIFVSDIISEELRNALGIADTEEIFVSGTSEADGCCGYAITKSGFYCKEEGDAGVNYIGFFDFLEKDISKFEYTEEGVLRLYGRAYILFGTGDWIKDEKVLNRTYERISQGEGALENTLSYFDDFLGMTKKYMDQNLSKVNLQVLLAELRDIDGLWRRFIER